MLSMFGETRARSSLSGIESTKLRSAMDKAFKVEEYRNLSNFGIDLSDGAVSQMIEGLTRLAMDNLTPTLTSGSVLTPIQFLQVWLPGFVHMLTAARKIDELVGIKTAGSWEDEEIVQGILEYTGTALPYHDYTDLPLSSWNPNFTRRTIVRFEEGMQVGLLEERRAARVNIADAAEKRAAAAMSLEIKRNLVGFFGYNATNQQTYGFLNDPNLPAYIAVPAGAAGPTTWVSKTYAEIIADIRTFISAVVVKSGDLIDPETTAMTLALPTGVVEALGVVNPLGNQSVRQWLRETYPKVRVVTAPELTGANGGANVAYLYADKVNDGASTDGGQTFIQLVQTKFMVLGVEKRVKVYEEGFSNATAGVLAKRPFAIYRATGI